jgi:hypothetical protein
MTNRREPGEEAQLDFGYAGTAQPDRPRDG